MGSVLPGDIHVRTWDTTMCPLQRSSLAVHGFEEDVIKIAVGRVGFKTSPSAGVMDAAGKQSSEWEN